MRWKALNLHFNPTYVRSFSEFCGDLLTIFTPPKVLFAAYFYHHKFQSDLRIWKKTPKKLHQISPCKSFSTDYTMINCGVFWEFFEDEIGRHILHFINKDLHVNRNFWNLKFDFWIWKNSEKTPDHIFWKVHPNTFQTHTFRSPNSF